MTGEMGPITTPREPMARKTPSLSFQPGAVIGGYKIIEPIGTGGMGRVFLAEDPNLDRKVALKILPPEDADDEGRARFLREAQALARVRHKNVVQVFASGVDDDVAWMALEYVQGDPLSALTGSAGIDEETALALCGQAARGLAAVHEVGVVHRDVKPDNLLLDDNAVVRVLDFGVALFVDGLGRGGFQTQKGVAVGTPHFMAPEQARGGTIDARADAWGLGATLYSLLAGRPPFYVRDDEPDLDILARVLRDRAADIRTVRPNVTAATAALVARLLEPDADKRLADMNVISEALDEIADAIAAGETPPAPPEQAQEAAEPAASVVVSEAPKAKPAPAQRSAFGVLIVAALFASLGALVAFQFAGQIATAARGPAASVVDAGLAAAAVDAGIAAAAPPPPLPPPPVEPPSPPTARDLAGRVIQNPSDNEALYELISREDPQAQDEVRLLAAMPGDAGDATVEALSARNARHHLKALEGAVMEGGRGRARRAMQILVDWKPFEAIEILDRAARGHTDAVIRREALAAKEKIFKIEGE